MQIDTKKFKSFKRKVLKKYPQAKTQMNSSGEFYISDGFGSKVGDEFMIPPQKDVAMAWYWASRTVQLEQNLNRTHPMRSDMNFDEKKFNRVSRRNRKK